MVVEFRLWDRFAHGVGVLAQSVLAQGWLTVAGLGVARALLRRARAVWPRGLLSVTCVGDTREVRFEPSEEAVRAWVCMA